MKGRIIYIEGHKASEAQSKEAYNSFVKHGYEVELYPGLTPETIDESEFPFKDLPGGRLESFKTNEPEKYLLKKSCVFNNLRFYRDVIEADETMLFIEHDAICIAPWNVRWQNFDDYCFLSYEYCWQKPNVLSRFQPLVNYMISHVRTTPLPYFNGVNKFKENYPLKYYKDSIYHGAVMSPGTAAYAVTPAGAKKMLDAAKKNGIDQSDFQINSKVLGMTFAFPSPVKYNKENLNTSHNL
jgi:GR25 family glycosyltransferase involved in LPS biosynthesis